MTHFGQFRFDEADRMLWRGQQPLPLTRKAGNLLACLLAARGNWVSKTDILAAVWPDTHVHPDNIKVLVREIRLALQDDAREPRFIRSQSGRGYAFIAETSERPSRDSSGLASELPLFMNRNGELAALSETLDMVRAGSSLVAVVRGERGIGKTALCDVFVRSAGSGTPVRAASGECIEQVSESEPLFPFLDAFGRLGRQYPSVVPRVLAEHAPAWFARFPHWGGRADWGPADQASLMAQLPDALAALAHDVPLVLTLEDLQWADAATIEVVTRFAHGAGTARWLLIATVCPYDSNGVSSAIDRLVPAIRAAPSAIVLDLAPLTPSQVTRYVDARFGPGCLTELAPALHAASSGNPFMMVAAVDGLLALGVVRAGDEEWHRDLAVGALADLLPQLLRDIVWLQLDQLGPEERRLLEAACAVGVEFTAGAVAVAADIDVGAVQRLFEPLADRGHILLRARPPSNHRSIRSTAYRFRHAMYAEQLAERAPLMQQIRAAHRLAVVADRRERRA
jgi:DNA-binding winged helix-turn-helix (wHTH) protein